MYEEINPYIGYDPGGLTPQDLLSMINSIRGSISSTLSRVERNENEMHEMESKITQEIDRINLRVLEVSTELDGTTARVGQLEVRAGEIELTVMEVDTRLGAAESTLTLLPGMIESKVSLTDYNGNTIASLINQTATTVKIIAQNIDLIGITNVAHELQIGASSTSGTNKRIIFNGQNVINDNGTRMQISAEQLNIDSAYGAFEGSWSFAGANSINWGSHAPVARFA